MISGLVLKYLNGECFVIRRGYETARPVSSSFCLTAPGKRFGGFANTNMNGKQPSTRGLVGVEVAHIVQIRNLDMEIAYRINFQI